MRSLLEGDTRWYDNPAVGDLPVYEEDVALDDYLGS